MKSPSSSLMANSLYKIFPQGVMVVVFIILDFRTTAEIHARSLANFCCQNADRRMNLKFMRRSASERERAIRQFVIVKNKLISVCNTSVLLLAMNFVIASKQCADPQLL